MSIEIRLIGEPAVSAVGLEPYRPRSRKTWALLGYLLLAETAPTRRQLSSLLFSEANDPLRALRWSLSELRRVLGQGVGLEGDPVVLDLPSESEVDVRSLAAGKWEEAINLETFGGDLLDGFETLGSPHFQAWLLNQQRHVAAITDDVLHEACLGYLGRDKPEDALPIATLLVGRNPYVESYQALLVRAYALSGDPVGAERQLQACVALFAKELGVSPGPAVRLARAVLPRSLSAEADEESVWAVIEAGSAAIAAGAPEAGVVSLRSGVSMADSTQNSDLRALSRLHLAEALVHSVRGDDEEGAELLHGAMAIAQVSRMGATEAMARVELGYVDMLAGRYTRAKKWLDVGKLTTSDPDILIKALTYSGVAHSDQAFYEQAGSSFEDAIQLARKEGEGRREAYVLSMMGRSALLLGDPTVAIDHLSQAIAIAEGDNWLAFLPWAQAFLGEALVELGDLPLARRVLRQAFARACQIGDPCWEGMSGRGLALLAEAEGQPDEALRLVQDALLRSRRMADTYRWAEVYILETQSRVAVEMRHRSAGPWVAELMDIASRTGMRELQLRAMVLGAQSGSPGGNPSIDDLAQSIKNPRLSLLL